MSLTRAAMTIGLAFACGCWPARPDELSDDESSSGANASLCFDGVRNGDETDIDCGGSTCGGCFGDAHCDDHADCASGFCGAERCAYVRSCRQLQELASGVDGVFWVDFDADGPDAPAKVLCDQTLDGGGWMLGFKVNRAAHDGVSERRETIRDGFNPQLLLDVDTPIDRGVASHGTIALSHSIEADAWARITLVAGADEAQQATWFKRIASARSLSRWFYDDDESSKVCVEPVVTDDCDEGTIGVSGDRTLLSGVDLRAHGYTADEPLQMRLSGTDVDYIDPYNSASGVCSRTQDADGNAWNDTQGFNREWGNGLLIWIR